MLLTVEIRFLHGNKILSKHESGYQTHVKGWLTESEFEQITLDTLRDFGIQVNSDSERRVLFSIWSPFSTDDPSLNSSNFPNQSRYLASSAEPSLELWAPQPPSSPPF